MKQNQHFRFLKSALLTKVRQARNYFFDNRMAELIKNDPSKFCRYFGNTKAEVFILNVDGVTLTNASSIAESFNYCFHSVFCEREEYEPQATASDLPQDGVTPEGVLEIILDIDTHKAAGPDGLPNLFLR